MTTIRGVEAIDWVRDGVLLAHLLGFGALFGGAVSQARSPEPAVNGAMVVGALTQLLTGVVLVLLPPVVGEERSPVVIGVKVGLTLVVALLVVANRRFESIPRGVWGIITGATLVAAVLSVLG